jgi:Kef-type K+ transport system membrane component KefB
MSDLDLGNLLAVAAVAFAAPLAISLIPGVRVPAVVFEIVLGIALGPAGLGAIKADEPVQVLALVGLAFLLFLSGLELDVRKLQGRAVSLAAKAFALSLVIAAAFGVLASATGLVADPTLVAVALVATSLGVVVPVLKDAGHSDSDLGQLVIAAASLADVGAIILLSALFGAQDGGTGSRLALLGMFVLAGGVIALALLEAERSSRLSAALLRLQDTTAQIRVRGAFVLLLAFAVVASHLGLEVILGAFAAGAVLSALDRDELMSHPQFRLKLEAAGYGVFIPVFFVSSGLGFNLHALTSSASGIAKVPIFLAALLLVRGAPALLYRGEVGPRGARAAGLLQATSLPFIVTATMIGQQIGAVTAATAAALVSAGLASVLLFPLLALTTLKDEVAHAPA